MDGIKLAGLPKPLKIVLTLFLLLVGAGYLSAIGNLYHQHALADGVAGLTLDDLRATFHGMGVEPPPGDEQVPRSRMMEMIEPGGKMRKHLMKGGEEAVRALEAWLKRGASRDAFAAGSVVADGDPSAKRVIENNCLRCHNAEEGEREESPFGPDLFEVEYEMVYEYAAPGTAEMHLAEEEAGVRRRGPSSLGHLFLVTHIHMLSMPVFTLIVGALFCMTGVESVGKAVLAPLPMAVLVLDFSSWWLARLAEPFIYCIAAAGLVYGVALAMQLLIVLSSLWYPRRLAA